jgi:hypothetical protein
MGQVPSIPGMLKTRSFVAPYVAGNFAVYEILRGWMSNSSGEPPGTLGKLLAGALAGSISQTVSDVVERSDRQNRHSRTDTVPCIGSVDVPFGRAASTNASRGSEIHGLCLQHDVGGGCAPR